jgi:hypothetical protein
VFAVDTSRIGAAISYYGDYVGEIDPEITEADKASVRAEARDPRVTESWLLGSSGEPTAS